jgi:hypothetical protein
VRGLDFQTLHLPFAAGLDQKSDPRAMQPPSLARAVDVQFDEVGGLQTRYPYANLATDTTDGGTIADCRRIVPNGSEFLLFTKDALYSWNAQLAKWAKRSDYLAVKVEEANQFVTGNDQYDCDCGVLNGTVVYAWTESYTGIAVGYVAAVDETTGSVLMTPTAIPYIGNVSRARVTPLETKIILSYKDSLGGVYAFVLDPADPAAGLAAGNHTLSDSGSEDYYDIVKVPSADAAVFAARRTPTTSYAVGTIDSSGTVNRTTKARTCDGPVAVSASPDGLLVQVFRLIGSTIECDHISVATLADVFTGTAVGTASSSVAEITAAHKSTDDGGEYRAYVFWSDGTRSTDGIVGWETRTNWCDTAGTTGTEGTFLRRLDIASRAFEREGRIFVWMVHAGEIGTYGTGGAIQNGLFLYRDDAFLVGKAAWNRASGFASVAYLPSVQNLDDGMFGYCATERTVFGASGANVSNNGYTGRRPRVVTFTFDSNEARRTARLGRTLYISGGEILQYDGVNLTELGFHVWPWYFGLTVAAGGSLADGSYGYKLSLRSDNAQAERDRSAAVYIQTVAVTGGPKRVQIGSVVPLYVTHKSVAAVELWRTEVDAPEDAPYHLVTTSDPTDATNPNRYLPNDTTALFLPTVHDDLSDADLEALPTFPQDVTLPSLAPPAATIVYATDSRLFLAGVAGEPNSVWYSKPRSDGDVAAFHGALVTSVPAVGGDITALAHLNETLIVFRATAIYAMPGDGFDQTGGGQNFGPARALSTDIGAVNHESVAVTDKGLVFKSSKGWYLLNKGWSLEYIGGGVSDYDDEDVQAVDVVESQHQVRILSSYTYFGAPPVDPWEVIEGPSEILLDWYTISRILVLDTLVGQWAEWSESDAVHACMWNGTHVVLADYGPRQQQESYTGVAYGIDVETGWIKLADLQGYGRVKWFELLGEYASAHRLRIRVARDYWKDGADTYFDEKIWTASPTTVGARLQVRHGPSIQQLSAIKIRITALGTAANTPPDGEALKLSGLGLELGFKRGLNRLLPAAQKQ